MRHRIAGNRINMPEARRRAAIRSLIDGLYTWEHVTTTEARAKAVRGEAERLIAIAIRGHEEAWNHLKSVVEDDFIAEQTLAIARRARFTLDEKIASNEEREAQGKFPLSAEARKIKEERLARFQKEMLGIIKDREEAQRALTTAREAMAIELHARRTILKHLPHERAVKKIFEQFVPRYAGRNGGYTRITRIGRRKGDASEMVRLELV
ncbi:MAG TPA: bL17 family ribosomal protein [Ktedonobacterales bacterium]|nr:bL17 family ribosomal protein [Ktedonobacterales bacterium]